MLAAKTLAAQWLYNIGDNGFCLRHTAARAFLAKGMCGMLALSYDKKYWPPLAKFLLLRKSFVKKAFFICSRILLVDV